ncbi:hypothetical protein Pelo_233 [Pelomyxa schiedti]|nr:hypothetical protein Pelo_233 [Pelomyxa schiedti]
MNSGLMNRFSDQCAQTECNQNIGFINRFYDNTGKCNQNISFVFPSFDSAYLAFLRLRHAASVPEMSASVPVISPKMNAIPQYDSRGAITVPPCRISLSAL